uniref:Uncharacterized protein n=1 Tax=Arundo donax TaxID=35708 RepID=A0A0A9BZN8_ARUDO
MSDGVSPEKSVIIDLYYRWLYRVVSKPLFKVLSGPVFLWFTEAYECSCVSCEF